MSSDPTAVRPRRVPELRRIALVVVALLAGVTIALVLTAPEEDAGPLTAPVAADGLADEIARLQSRVEADPTDVAAWQQLGERNVRRAEQTGDPAFYAAAEAAFNRAEELAPDDATTTIGRGVLALTRHEFADALTLGREALDALPRSPAALGVVVDAQVELGRYEAAADTLQTLLDTRPDLRALARTSYVRELNGDLEGAIVAMQQAATAGQVGGGFEYATVQSLLGDLLLRSGDVAGAEQAYEVALDNADGDLPLATMGLARVAVAVGDLDAAVTSLEDLTTRRLRPDALLLQGELQRLAGQDEEARSSDELVAATSQLAQAAGQVVDLELALFEADHGDPARAVALATAAFEARQTIFTNIALATGLVGVEEAERALPLAEAAVARATPHAELWVRAALVAHAAGDLGRAAEWLERGFALAPWFALGQVDAARDLAARLARDLERLDADERAALGVDVAPVVPPGWAAVGG